MGYRLTELGIRVSRAPHARQGQAASDHLQSLLLFSSSSIASKKSVNFVNKVPFLRTLAHPTVGGSRGSLAATIRVGVVESSQKKSRHLREAVDEPIFLRQGTDMCRAA
jgi:hypothetical protein